jgi:hypothetical protein
MTSKEYAKKIKEQRRKASLIPKIAKFFIYSLIVLILFFILRRFIKKKQFEVEINDKQVDIKPEKNE